MSIVRTVLTETQGNLLIASLDPSERASWEPYIERVTLQAHDELFNREEALDSLWFPQSGVFSHVVESSTGGSVDVMTIGREGVAGLPALFGVAAPTRVIAHEAASVLRVRIEDFVHLAGSGHPLRGHLDRYAGLLVSSLTQISACNTLHSAEQRLSRWLLRAHDCMQSGEIAITHDVLSLMLGTRRASVTRAAQHLQQRGCIRYERGVLHYADLPELERASCECHAIVRRLHQTFKSSSTSPTI